MGGMGTYDDIFSYNPILKNGNTSKKMGTIDCRLKLATMHLQRGAGENCRRYGHHK
jgi:hypothetical protein